MFSKGFRDSYYNLHFPPRIVNPRALRAKLEKKSTVTGRGPYPTDTVKFTISLKGFDEAELNKQNNN